MKSRKREIGRLPGHNYANNSCYFVTSCTFNKQPFLARIDGNSLVLTEAGEIVRDQIEWVGKQFPYVRIKAFAIMPDHIHILIKYASYSYADKMKIKPLSEIVGAIKMTSSKLIHVSGFWEFRWQARFYESIIRNKKHYYAVRMYIRNNPEKYLKRMGYDMARDRYRIDL